MAYFIDSWFLWSIISLGLLYWYFTRNFGFFTKQGIRGPRPLPCIGNLWEMYFTSMPDLELQRYKKYGKIYGLFEGNKPILRIGDPELVKQIMVKDFHVYQTRRPGSNAKHPVADLIMSQSRDDEWRRMRTTATPSFSTAKLRRVCELMNRSLDQFVDAVRTKALPERVVDIKWWYACYSMDVIANCIFGATTQAYADPNDPMVVNGRAMFRPVYWRWLATMLFPTWLLNWLNIHSETNDKSIDYFCQFTRQLMRLKEREGTEGNREFSDFINLLTKQNNMKREFDGSIGNEGKQQLEVDESDGELNPLDANTPAANKYRTTKQSTLRPMTEDEVIAQVFSSLTGGFEAGNNALAFCTLELALHPDIQERVYDEVVSVTGESGDGRIDYETLARMTYLDAVVSETQRFHSAALRPTRVAAMDHTLGDTGIHVRKGQTIELMAYAMHRSDEYWPRADRFDPERFMPENRHLINQYAYIPFGAGPRACIGQRFSLMMIKLGVARMVRQFKFRPCERTRVPTPLVKNMRFKAAQEVYLSVETRA
ncbi:unnamed protein product [Medioppia subpectinata]|uniref:Cytochrome P450 n=1 Tax=Medioppia subpectinata TaxID=1979941 RepID=A0A7R9L2X9_9ACAR|nr:unnamed protein product [Medioppia subpectinata]CAG2113351.1 unnamed protein product [Medioppia subpectinata]